MINLCDSVSLCVVKPPDSAWKASCLFYPQWVTRVGRLWQRLVKSHSSSNLKPEGSSASNFYALLSVNACLPPSAALCSPVWPRIPSSLQMIIQRKGGVRPQALLLIELDFILEVTEKWTVSPSEPCDDGDTETRSTSGAPADVCSVCDSTSRSPCQHHFCHDTSWASYSQVHRLTAQEQTQDQKGPVQSRPHQQVVQRSAVTSCDDLIISAVFGRRRRPNQRMCNRYAGYKSWKGP